MRFPVFARGADPSRDRHIQRKKMSYLEEQVRFGRADWIDSSDKRKGIIARELLDFGFVAKAEPEPESGFDFIELPGLKFVPPKTTPNPTLPRLQIASLAASAQEWDWTREQLA